MKAAAAERNLIIRFFNGPSWRRMQNVSSSSAPPTYLICNAQLDQNWTRKSLKCIFLLPFQNPQKDFKMFISYHGFFYNFSCLFPSPDLHFFLWRAFQGVNNLKLSRLGKALLKRLLLKFNYNFLQWTVSWRMQNVFLIFPRTLELIQLNFRGRKKCKNSPLKQCAVL